MAALAESGEFRLDAMTKGACPVVDVMLYNAVLSREYRECRQWGARVMKVLLETEPDLVISTGAARGTVVNNGRPLTASESDFLKAAGHARYYRELNDAGIPVVHITDTPFMLDVGEVPQCVAINLENLEKCAVSEQSAVRSWQATGLIEKALPAGSVMVDMTDAFCSSGTCPSVIGGVIVYRDVAHMTTTYAKTLAPFLFQELLRAVPEAFVVAGEFAPAEPPPVTPPRAVVGADSTDASSS